MSASLTVSAVPLFSGKVEADNTTVRIVAIIVLLGLLAPMIILGVGLPAGITVGWMIGLIACDWIMMLVILFFTCGEKPTKERKTARRCKS